jgi:hypothetical protein
MVNRHTAQLPAALDLALPLALESPEDALAATATTATSMVVLAALVCRGLDRLQARRP